MYTRNRIIFFILICLIGSGCTSHSSTKNNLLDEIVYMDSLAPSPVAELMQWNAGDPVAILDTNENFHVQAECLGMAPEMYLVISVYNRRANPEWITADQYQQYFTPAQNFKLLQVVKPAVQIRLGEGRLASTTWLQPEKVFPAPWKRNYELNEGDTIKVKRFGDFPVTEGIILTAAEHPGDHFTIQYIGYSGKSIVNDENIYITIRPLTTTDIRPGKIVYFDNMYWVMVIATDPSGKILVREEGFPARDKWVPIERLQLLE